MRFQTLFFTAIFSLAVVLNGCSNQTAPVSSTNGKSANANGAATTNTNNPLGTTKTPETATSNDAPTLAPVVQGYYAALQKKDEAGAKRFLSQSALKYWADEMKTEKQNSLLAILEDDAAPVEAKREVRNEKIEGDAATAEIKGGSSAAWTPVKFARESGEWKFASPKDSFALQDIKNSAPNADK